MIIKTTKEISLIDLLMAEFVTGTKSGIKRMILNGNILLNGHVITRPVEVIKQGDVVEYKKYKALPNTWKAPFPVLFEDDVILVVEKPAGILTHAERGAEGTSLYKEMLEYIKERSKGNERIYVVHRLDREVSGIILFAKSELIQQQVKENWRETKKRYYALIHGRPKKGKDTLTSWLMEGRDQRVHSVREQDGAKQAITHYEVIKELPAHTLLEVTLETGRKNQIRVHLSEMGCPVVGDWRYGSKDRVKRRIRLHAFYFSMNHPVTGALLEFKSRLPRGFLTLLDKEEKYK
jgi:23S rRNA pseudouridine1911/1915/1917 synthase